LRKLTLITGGSRSGKSRFALDLGLASAGPRLFVATCPILDEEMAARIARHRAERGSEDWDTLETQTNLETVLREGAAYPVILIDCLTLWINNLMYAENEAELSEDDIAARCRAILNLCETQSGDLILVSNEVGMGLVPDRPLGRRFRDLSGRAQQCFARRAERLVLMVAGHPLWVKGAPKS